MNVCAALAFDGSAYHGWQRQKHSICVQQLLDEALSNVFKTDITSVGCSRTDAKVHATMYVCNFVVSECRVPFDKLPVAINAYLPRDIRVFKCFEVPSSFSARFSAKSKTYTYKIYNEKILNPFLLNYTYFFSKELNIEKMNSACPYFIGEHDFAAFVASGGGQKTTVREIFDLKVSKDGSIIEIVITANAYLYNMVRIIAGTLCSVGCGRIQPDEIADIIKSKDRQKAGITAPPQGLYLTGVNY